MKKLVILLFVCSIGFFNLFAQTTQESVYASEIFESKQDGLNLLSSFNNNPVANNYETPAVHGVENFVLIEQIGYDNNIFSSTQSQSSDIKLIQNGDFNNINLGINAPRIDATIVQNGNNNSAVDNIYYTNLDVSLNLTQNGDNLTFNRIGVNSLTNKIQFVQEGSHKTITVISN